MPASVVSEIFARLATLDPDRQGEVLEFIKGLARPLPPGTPPDALLKFAGSIPDDVLDDMEKAIEEACEQVDPEPDVDFDAR